MIARVPARQSHQFEERIRDYVSHDFARLVGAVTLVCGTRAAAEEAVQEALARAWEHEMKGTRIDSLPAWVTTVAMNLARSSRRRLMAEVRARQRLQRGLAGGEPGRHSVDLSDERLDLFRAIRRLPRRQREAIALCYFTDLTRQEISQIVGLSDGGVRALVFRARRNLMDSLRDAGATIEEEPPDAGS